MKNRRSFGSYLSSSAALVILLFFFLPWATVSCEGEEIDTLSGYDVAVGKDIDLGVGTEEMDPDLLIFVVPAAALVVIVLVILAATGSLSPTLAYAGQISAATIGLMTLAYKYLEAQNDASEVDYVTVSIEYGVWITVAGFIAIIAGALWARLQQAKTLPADQEESDP